MGLQEYTRKAIVPHEGWFRVINNKPSPFLILHFAF